MDHELLDWLRQNDLNITPILDNQVHRFSMEGTKDKSGWYLGSVKIIGNKRVTTLTVGDWKWSDEDRLYFMSGGIKNGELEELKKLNEQRKKEIDEETKKIQEEAAIEAKKLWENSKEADPSHPYLQKKQIKPLWIRQSGDTLLVPMRDIHEKLWGIQRIYPDGTKRFLKGQKTKGLFLLLEGTTDGIVCVCEGLATGLSINQAAGYRIYVGFNAGNIRDIAKVASELETTKKILICGDDDKWGEINIGRKKAEEAAREVGGMAIFPVFKNEESHPTDWNDLHCLEGIEEVKRQIGEGIKVGGDYKASDSSVDKGGFDYTKEPETEQTKIDKEIDEIGAPRYLVRKKLSEMLKNQKELELGKDEVGEINRILKTYFSEWSSLKITKKFLTESGFLDKGKCFLRYYQDDFYRYKNDNGFYYQKLDDHWLNDKLYSWLIKNDLAFILEGKKLPAIQKMLRIRPMYIPEKISSTCEFVSGSWISAKHLIPLKNGFFNIKKFIKENEIEMIKNSQNIFNTYKLPYNYEPGATCPTFDSICNDILDKPEIEVLEEILGVHIFSPFLIEKFFVFCGEGSNGKGVIYTIMECLLGKENISNVTLDCFNSNSFAFYNVVGKLANVIPDMHDISEIDEGTLKAYVSRESMLFNRKNKPHVSAEPSAFLTILTNQLPRFTDKSDGIWRRMILLKFNKTIPQEKQNPKFRKKSFWENSGELPGIFNKALLGLKRVVERGYILETENMKAEVEEYKTELNFVMQFAQSKLEFGDDLKCKSKEVYEKYTEMVKQNGGKPLGAPSFSRQLKAVITKMGKKVEFGTRNERIGDYAGRVWHGFYLINEEFPF